MITSTTSDGVTMPGGEGTFLANRYRIVRQLGQGGMGSVWLAEDKQLDNKQFAIKMLPSILVSNKRAYRQLKDEALVAMKLTHPNIVTLRAFEENNGNPFLVMDCLDGQTLDDYLSEKGKLSEAEIIKLLKPVAAALDYAHDEHVVHRDVKPANVMIRNDGHPYILDFGIAREIQETMTRVTGKLSSGTLLYMSPEQLRGWSPTAAQDIYSFSAMVYECVAGHPPFYRGAVEDQIKNETPESLPASIAIANSVMAGLEKDPEARPSSCVDVLVSHGRTCPRPWSRHGTIGDDKTIEFEPEPSESIRRNWAWWWIAGSSIVFALLVAGGFLWKVSSSHDIATGPSVPVVPAVAVLPVNVEPAVSSPSEQAHIAEEQDRLKSEAARLRAEISAQCCSVTNAFEQVAEYREPADGFQHHLVKVDSLWKDVTGAELPDDASPEQLTNALMSVSNAVVGIQVEARWLEENRKTRDEILAVRKAADGLCDRLARLEGNHWQALQSYIDGTNSLTIASTQFAKGEFAFALESTTASTNLLQTAYSEEQEFIAREKAEEERIAREILAREAEEKRIVADARAYTNCLKRIALLQRDALDEYTKISLVKQNSEGFTPRLVKIDKLWNVINDNSKADTLVGVQETYALASNALWQITEEIKWVIDHQSLRNNIQNRRDTAMTAICQLQNDAMSKTLKWSVDPTYISATNRYATSVRRFTMGLLSEDLADEFSAIRSEIEQLYNDCKKDEPVVKSVTIEQSTETREVKVSYVLENCRAFITLDFLQNGRAAFPNGTVRTITGDINKWVEPGIHYVTWKCADDIPSRKIDNITAKVTASLSATESNVLSQYRYESKAESNRTISIGGDEEEYLPKNQIVLRAYVREGATRHYVSPSEFGTKADYKVYAVKNAYRNINEVIVESAKCNTSTFIVALSYKNYSKKVAVRFRNEGREEIEVELEKK